MYRRNSLLIIIVEAVQPNKLVFFMRLFILIHVQDLDHGVPRHCEELDGAVGVEAGSEAVAPGDVGDFMVAACSMLLKPEYFPRLRIHSNDHHFRHRGKSNQRFLSRHRRRVIRIRPLNSNGGDSRWRARKKSTFMLERHLAENYVPGEISS